MNLFHLILSSESCETLRNCEKKLKSEVKVLDSQKFFVHMYSTTTSDLREIVFRNFYFYGLWINLKLKFSFINHINTEYIVNPVISNK